MPTELTPITKCRVCASANLLEILSLGDLYVSAFVDDEEHEELAPYPLTLMLCDEKQGGCGLLQLRHTVPNEVMYRNYWYVSGTNKTMTDELHGIVRAAKKFVTLAPGDHMLDIGANDGTLLRGYATDPVVKVGFEPARNLIPVAQLSADTVINDFFNYDAWHKQFPGKKAKVVTAIAMFYDLEDPNAFVRDVAKLLHEDGVFIIQMSYLPLMLSQNAFDNICHEHLEYYSLRSLEHLLARHKLAVCDVELNDVNGGSFRVYIRHEGGGKHLRIPEGANERIAALHAEEKKLELSERKAYDAFAKRVEELKAKTVQFINNAKKRREKIYVYGASTKGNTLLQYYGLNHGHVPFAVERNPQKWGKKTVGSRVPIISEEQARADAPHYFLILPWHFLPEFREREKEFFARGGKFIVPLPELKIIGE